MAIEQFYTPPPPAQKNFIPPKQISGYAPDEADEEEEGMLGLCFVVRTAKAYVPKLVRRALLYTSIVAVCRRL